MAFYTGVDKERYDAGNKFLPMDQFLLDYQTPTTNTEEEVTTSYGIPAAAKSYKGYPSYADWLAAQGGTGGDGADEEDGPSYGRDYGTTGSWSPGGTYKNPNSMFSQLQNIPTPFNLAMKGITWGLDKFGAWNEARKEKKEQELKEEIKSHNIQAAISTREDKSGATGTRAGGFTNPGKGSYGPHKKDGGRIGYQEAGPVIDEETMSMIIDMSNRGIDLSTISTVTETPVETITSILSSLTQQADGGRIGLYGGGSPEDSYLNFIARRKNQGSKYDPSRGEYESYINRPILMGQAMPEGGLDEIRRQRAEQGPALFAVPAADGGRVYLNLGGIASIL